MGIVIDMAAARRARRRPAPPITAGALAAPALMGGVALFTAYVAMAFALSSVLAAQMNFGRR